MPKAPKQSTETPSRAIKLLALGLTIFAFFPYIAIYFVVPQYLEIAQELNTTLPAFTIFIFKYYQGTGLLPFIGLTPCIPLILGTGLSKKLIQGLFSLVVINFALSIVIFILVFMSFSAIYSQPSM